MVFVVYQLFIKKLVQLLKIFSAFLSCFPVSHIYTMDLFLSVRDSVQLRGLIRNGFTLVVMLTWKRKNLEYWMKSKAYYNRN